MGLDVDAGMFGPNTTREWSGMGKTFVRFDNPGELARMWAASVAAMLCGHDTAITAAMILTTHIQFSLH